MDFTQYLPEGAKETLLQERIVQLASEGLANQIAKSEAEGAGNTEQAGTYATNIAVIAAAIGAHEVTLAATTPAATTPAATTPAG